MDGAMLMAAHHLSAGQGFHNLCLALLTGQLQPHAARLARVSQESDDARPSPLRRNCGRNGVKPPDLSFQSSGFTRKNACRTATSAPENFSKGLPVHASVFQAAAVPN